MDIKDEVINDLLEEDNEYWLRNDDDVRNIASELSDDIILQTIYEQIDNNLRINENDILANFENRYQYILMFYGNDKKIIETCKKIRNNIYTKILEKICNKLDISTNLLTDEFLNHSDEFYFYVKCFYEFFILKYKENICNLFVNYLYNNRDTLVENYKNSIENKNDLLIKSLKKVFDNSNDAYLIYLAETIVVDYINNELTSEDLINEITNTDPYELTNASIKELLIDNKFETYCGNSFVNNFFNPLKDEEYRYDLLIEIKFALVNLIKKFNMDKLAKINNSLKEK